VGNRSHVASSGSWQPSKHGGTDGFDGVHELKHKSEELSDSDQTRMQIRAGRTVHEMRQAEVGAFVDQADLTAVNGVGWKCYRRPQESIIHAVPERARAGRYAHQHPGSLL
jgi:hypothetical protein